jgi:hypothetical protein
MKRLFVLQLQNDCAQLQETLRFGTTTLFKCLKLVACHLIVTPSYGFIKLVKFISQTLIYRKLDLYDYKITT